MTYYAPPNKVPYDSWFDKDAPEYYPPLDRNGKNVYSSHPYDNWPVAKDDSIHQKMYDLATRNGTTLGGSENVRH